MDPHDRDILQQTLELAEENNKLLRRMHTSMVWGRVVRVIYWVIIIGSAVGAYYYVEPYLNSLLKIYNSIPNAFGGIHKVIEAEAKINTLF
ncbi:MAG: hypothetical protein WC757_00930 [Candidatus Paceibacterota bacterium]|jgi:hypothetical protein